MAAIGEVQGVQQLLRKLEKFERESHRKHTGSVIVGYAASYALYVHEAHRSKSKFLESPAREMTNSGELRRVVRDAAKAGAPLVKALLLAGLRLQRASQKVVPVDTGNLRGSAFTEEE